MNPLDLPVLNNGEEVKEYVKERYAQIVSEGDGCGCSSGCCGTNEEISSFREDYTHLPGYVGEADFGLGCGIPVEFAGIKAGDTIVDLGSGAGNDVFVARALTGETGKVIGIDMTPAMIAKANKNKEKLGFTNVSFIEAEIENMPLPENTADVIVSNCVLNLVPSKERAFAEMYRILKPGGHFTVSDVVIEGEMSPELQRASELWAGCVTGAIAKDKYLNIIAETGFTSITIHKTRELEVPAEILQKYLSVKAIEDYKNKVAGIYSITVSAVKA